MISTYQGVVIDEKNETIPGANVWVSDPKGKRISDKAHVKSDMDGKYSLTVAAPIMSPTGKLNMVPIGTHITIKAPGLPFVIVPIDFSGNGIKKQDLSVIPKEYTTNEVVITASRDKLMCEKAGGVWNETTKTCAMPPSKLSLKDKWRNLSNLQKGLIIVSGAAVIMGAAVLISKATKNGTN